MKFLKIIIVMFILLISVGVVCATDTTFGDNQDDLRTMQDEICEAGDVKTFTDLDNDIKNSTDVLEILHDYKFNNGTDETDGITINKGNFVINGNGHTIDGNNQSGIFLIKATNITINNLTFINANASRGSVFYINNNCLLTTNNVTFKDDFATDMGVIYLARGIYISNDDKFIDLKSANYGVIMSSSSNVTFNNALMVSSRQLSWGFIFAHNDSNVFISNSLFANATSKNTQRIRMVKLN